MTVQSLQANIPNGASIFLVRGDGAQLEIQGTTAAPSGTFYQTVEDDGSPLPQRTALNLINATLADNAGNGSTDLTLHYQFWQDSDGDLPQRRAVKPNSVHFDVTDDALGDETRFGLHSPIAPTVGLSPLKGTYFVNPGFVGTSTGSQSNPFTTFMGAGGAFAQAIALGVNSATFFIPPGTTITEDLVFPDTGGEWEVACVDSYVLSQSSAVARIVGTITISSTAAVGTTSFALSNLFIQGNIAGNVSAGLSVLFMKNIRQTGTCITTVSGTGIWISSFKGVAAVAPSKFGGSTTGLVSIAGLVTAVNWVFEGGVSDAQQLPGPNPPFASSFRGCQFGATTSSTPPIGLGSNALVAHFFDCSFTGATTFTAANANFQLFLDAASLASVMRVGVVLVGTGLVLKTLNANASDTRTVANNLGSTAYGARDAAGLYEVDFECTLLVAGTLGLLQLNVIYTDQTGTLVTAPVGGTLDITGAVGSKQQGSLRFQHNGAVAPVAYSLTGIVTPGAMSVAVATSIQRRN